MFYRPAVAAASSSFTGHEDDSHDEGAQARGPHQDQLSDDDDSDEQRGSAMLDSQRDEGEERSEGTLGPRGPPRHAVGGTIGGAGRGLEKSEEDYFNASDEEAEDTTSGVDVGSNGNGGEGDDNGAHETTDSAHTLKCTRENEARPADNVRTRPVHRHEP